MSEEEFLEYKKSLEVQINKDISDNSQKLIDSFVDYYGEQYRKVITEKYNNIKFVYYISNFLIFYILDNTLQKYKNGEKIDYGNVLGLCLYLYESGSYKNYLTADNFKQQDIDLLTKKMIGISDETLLKDSTLFMQILYMINRKQSDDPYEYNIPSKDMSSLNTIISLPIYSIDDESLIHEINHAICTNIIGMNESNNKLIQCGLNISSKHETNRIMELVNDAQAKKIFYIFKNKYGGNIFTSLTSDSIDKEAEQNKYGVIKLFFATFENELKEACISGDLNILFNKLGSYNFELICGIINSDSNEKEKSDKISEVISTIQKQRKSKL